MKASQYRTELADALEAAAAPAKVHDGHTPAGAATPLITVLYAGSKRVKQVWTHDYRIELVDGDPDPTGLLELADRIAEAVVAWKPNSSVIRSAGPAVATGTTVLASATVPALFITTQLQEA